ncbi:MAG: hypothetical protein R6V47_01660 [Candidatus Delongbacteria bacterium]
MKYTIVLALLLITVASFSASDSTDNDPVPSWQQSESVNIQLGVRDKNGALEFYDAVFVVTAKKGGKKFEKNIQVKKDKWGFVLFPEDFKAVVKDGDYDWECRVDGNVTAYGRFTYDSLQRILTIPEK